MATWCAVTRAPNNCSRYWIRINALQIRRRPQLMIPICPPPCTRCFARSSPVAGRRPPAGAQRQPTAAAPASVRHGAGGAAAGRGADGAKRILIVGDFDCDGATNSALCVLALRAMGGHIDFLVPNRFEFGYGLTPDRRAGGMAAAPSS